MDSSLTALAIILGMALYPFFSNNLTHQRQNASAVIGVVLQGFVLLGHGALLEVELGSPVSGGFQFFSYLFFGAAYLGRTQGVVKPNHGALLPYVTGAMAAFIAMFSMSALVHFTVVAIQASCLLAITKSYRKLPSFILVKALCFILLYCTVNALFYATTTTAFNQVLDISSVRTLYYLLLISCTAHMVFQDFSRTRIRKGLGHQTKVDRDLIKMTFRGRRVLKDFKHDLRQPLSTLGILASVGKAISKDPEVSARYQHIQTAQKALKNMLEDFFDQVGNAIQYPNDNNSMTLQPISLDDVLSPLIEEYRMLAAGKELQIRYLPSEAHVLSNKEALSKILRNGLDNAIKYTNKGGVVVGLRRRKGQLSIQIVDTGSGVENNKVAAHNKGWGHGSNIVRELSEQILAKTECRNRYFKGNLAGSVFEVILPQENEVNHRRNRSSDTNRAALEVHVMAMNHEHLLEIQQRLPVEGFDKVSFSLDSAQKAYFTALRKGMYPVYIFYAGDPAQKQTAINQLKLLASFLDHEPCMILIYNACQEKNPLVEFRRDIIHIPFIPNKRDSNLDVIADLFPHREKVLSKHSHSPMAVTKATTAIHQALQTN